jgi:hypothetical protein
MRGFNRPQLVQAAAQFLGLKGDLPMQVDEQLLSIISMGELTDSPYLRYAIPVAEQGAVTAVALENSYVCIQPSAQVALQIKQILISNAEAVVQFISIAISTAAQIATAGLASGPNVVDFANPIAGTLRGSIIRTGTHTDTGQGNQIIVVRVAAGETFQLTLPDPGIILYGNDEGGIPALSLINNIANEGLRAAFIGREWPLPG